MKILVFDTETTGLPEKNANFNELNKYPYIIQLSYILYNIENNDIIIKDNYVKIDDSIKISKGSYEIHKITNELLKEKGKSIKDILNEFNELLNEVDMIVGHNLSFDKNLIIVECMRNNIKNNMIDKKEYCTMLNTRKLCNIIKYDKFNRSYYKYPKLNELYNILYKDEKINEDKLHNSLYDVLITLKCYIKLEYNINIEDKNDEIKNIIHYT